MVLTLKALKVFFLAEKNGVMKIKLSEIVLQICSKSLSLIKGGLK